MLLLSLDYWPLRGPPRGNIHTQIMKMMKMIMFFMKLIILSGNLYLPSLFLLFLLLLFSFPPLGI